MPTGLHHAIIVGLGSPVLGDEGVGWRVVDQVALLSDAVHPDADLERVSSGGLGLLERLVGYDRAVIVDGIRTGNAPVGSVRTVPLERIRNRHGEHTASAHDVSFAAALAAGRALGAHLPTHVTIVTIEIPSALAFGGHLSPDVAAAVPYAAAQALQAADESA